MHPERYGEILDTLIDLGIRNASERARQTLARQCADRGIDPREIKLAFQRAHEVEGKSRSDAARMVAAQLASPDTWSAYVDSARRAVLDSQAQSEKASDHEHGKNLRTSPQEIRRREFQAAGLSESDAHLVEIGGYVHARLVGDNHVPGDIAKEVGLDPWTALQAAAWWCDLFGPGRVSLRRALAAQIKSRRCAESLMEHLDAVTERTIDGDVAVPNFDGWRARHKGAR